MRYSLGTFVKKLFAAYVVKNNKLFRMNTTSFDSSFVTKDEKETLKNTESLRAYIRDLIRDRKEQMKNNKNGELKDFVSVLLTDDIYADDESLMIDECAVFFIAATQTTTALVTNVLFYMTMIKEYKQRLMKEIITQFEGVSQFSKATV